MLIESVVAEAFATNCYVVAAGAGSECVIVDPGIGVSAGVEAVVARHRLRPVAVMLTHGHFDHTFSVVPVCGARGIDAYVHPGDRQQLADPFAALPPQFEAMAGGLRWSEPEDVAQLPDDGRLSLAGLDVTVDHAPGHTPGSVLYRLRGPEAEYCLSGDVLFAGSIGRTDFPGGDSAAMERSLTDKVLPLDDATVVLPGHGPATTVGEERRSNPFLRRIAAGGHMEAPTRGL